MKSCKEYLDANCNYEFVLSNKKYDGFIEIPEGADKYVYFNEYDNANFYKGDFDAVWQDDGYWDHDMDDYKSYCKKFGVVLWQREQDEPFLTPECTLNDQYAEIEEVRQAIREEAQAAGGIDTTLSQRQSQYGCYEDVAHVTQQILSALRIGNYDNLPAPMKESLHMIASKMARIVNGDPEYLDNWHDIGGYAKLIEKLIEGN